MASTLSSCPNLGEGRVPAAKGEGGGPTGHPEPVDLDERVQDLLGEAVGEVTLVLPGGQVREGEHGNCRHGPGQLDRTGLLRGGAEVPGAGCDGGGHEQGGPDDPGRPPLPRRWAGDGSRAKGSVDGPEDRRERRHHLARVAAPVHRVLGQHAGDQRRQGGSLRHVQEACGPAARRRAPCIVREGIRTGQHPVEHHAEREDVGALVLGRPAPLLGRHVCRRAAVHLAPPEGLRHSQVEQLHAAVVAEEDVSGRQVAVDDPSRVGVGEAARHLDQHPQGLGERQGRGGEALRERLAVEELEDEVRPVVAPPHVVQGDDVRVGEAGGCLGLAQEPFLPSSRQDGAPQELECHRPSQVPVERLVDDAESAASQLTDDLETTDHRARRRCRSPRGSVGGAVAVGADQVLEKGRDAGRTWSGRSPSVPLPVVRHRHPR